ncbi:MAG: hypothetical protein QOD62_1116 [Actinomycetota bacterium]|nr:hypothetical protein [Actinomycetota bacterium]
MSGGLHNPAYLPRAGSSLAGLVALRPSASLALPAHVFQNAWLLIRFLRPLARRGGFFVRHVAESAPYDAKNAVGGRYSQRRTSLASRISVPGGIAAVVGIFRRG